MTDPPYILCFRCCKIWLAINQLNNGMKNLINVEDHIPGIVNQICFNINRSQSTQDSSGKLLPRGKSTANDAQLPNFGNIYNLLHLYKKSIQTRL